MSGWRDREADPLSIAAVIQSIVDRRRWSHRFDVTKVRRAWADLCGPTLGTRSEPIFLEDDGTLVVRAEDGMVATEIRMLAPLIIVRCNELLQTERVLLVKVRIGADKERKPPE